MKKKALCIIFTSFGKHPHAIIIWKIKPKMLKHQEESSNRKCRIQNPIEPSENYRRWEVPLYITYLDCRAQTTKNFVRESPKFRSTYERCSPAHRILKIIKAWLKDRNLLGDCQNLMNSFNIPLLEPRIFLPTLNLRRGWIKYQ